MTATGLQLVGKRVVLTGAAGGLGRAFALAFAREGASVLAADLDEAGAIETADLVRQAGGVAHACKLDVTSEASCAAVANVARTALGGADVLVNGAALLIGIRRAPFWELDPAEWDKLYAVNVKGIWLVSRAILPLLRESAAASIINIASNAAINGSPRWLHYTSSKGAVVSMTRGMARELGPEGIRANVVAPGVVANKAAFHHFEDADTYGVSRIPLGRQAVSEDIVGAVLHLASPLSGFMTGQTMLIDGGRDFV
jgi:NAD(P)-dependent dehydrogenase (short-subunit alcohol dehydrogenase family)